MHFELSHPCKCNQSKSPFELWFLRTLPVSHCGDASFWIKLFRSRSVKISLSLSTQAASLGSHPGFMWGLQRPLGVREQLSHWHGPEVLLRNDGAMTPAAADSLSAVLELLFFKANLFSVRFYTEISLPCKTTNIKKGTDLLGEDITELISWDITMPIHFFQPLSTG